MHRVLFVCGANVCRSPFMAYLFTQWMHGTGAQDEWAVVSRGVAFTGEMPLCGRVCQAIAPRPGGEEFVFEHTSRALTAELVSEADIVLTASTVERGAVARICPVARPWTFTLLEAGMLGDSLASAEQPRDTAAGTRPLRGYAHALHARRGLVGPKRVGLGTLFPSRTTLDINDGHVRGGREHRRTLRLVEAGINTFAPQVADFLES